MPASIRIDARELAALDEAPELTPCSPADLRSLLLELHRRMDFRSARVGLVTRVTRARLAEALAWTVGRVRYVLRALERVGLVAVESVGRRFVVHLALAKRDQPEPEARPPAPPAPPPSPPPRQRELRLHQALPGGPAASPEAASGVAGEGLHVETGRDRNATATEPRDTPGNPGDPRGRPGARDRNRDRVSGLRSQSTAAEAATAPDRARRRRGGGLRPVTAVGLEALDALAERFPELAARRAARQP